MKKRLLFIGFLLLVWGNQSYAQDSTKIDYTSERTSKNEEKYPGALLMYKVNDQVTFSHEGIKVWADQAIFYDEENFFRATGNVKMVQGDTITLNSEYAEYDGNTQFAFASNNVKLKTPTTTLTTDSLFFDRQKQQAFYRSGGKVQDTSSTITSEIGQYYVNEKMYSFLDDVVITSEDYTIHSDHVDYYTETGETYLYGPSTITSDENEIYCERGFYDTHKDYGYFVKNSKVFYEDRELEGDSLYVDRDSGFASATNNIKVIDTANNSVAHGHYAEVYNDEDSLFITKKALLSKQQKDDTVYLHSDTLMVTGPKDNHIIRAYNHAKLYKSDLNGKSDSIHLNEKKGITRMIGKPVLFSDNTQLTGDTIKLYNHTETNKLDSINIPNDAFLNQKDSIDGFNQVKGKTMYGLFEDNELREVHFIKNTETIYYSRNDHDQLIGINKAISSAINITFEDREIRFIDYEEDPENITYMPKDLPKNARKLKGFVWRGDEQILSKAQLFEDDPPLDLPKIEGIPLPDESNFFDDQDEEERPLLNEKSRLNSEILRNQGENNKKIKSNNLELKFLPDSISLPNKVINEP